MDYFKINNLDYSHFVSGLKITKNRNYNAQTNAAGNTVIDFINSKRTIEVSFIPLDRKQMSIIQSGILDEAVNISFLNPENGLLETITAFLPSNGIEYYTIQQDKQLFKSFTLTFTEL